jgi:PAS domain S-box-containing protein
MVRCPSINVELPSAGRLSGGLFPERPFDSGVLFAPKNSPISSVLRVFWSLLNSRLSLRRAFVLMILGLTSFGTAGATHKVLIVHSFGSPAPPFTTHSIAFETELTEQIGEPVDLDEVSLDNARYAARETEEALVDYLQKRQAHWQPDLVVPIGAPAAIFVAKYRNRLYPETPVLFTGMDKRRLPPDALQKNATFVGQDIDLQGFVRDILQIAPATTNITVIVGASSLEAYWKAAFQKEFEGFTNRVGFTWLNNLSLNQMLEKVQRLPPRSFIFLIQFMRDATGVSYNADDVLRRIHAVADAPVNSIFQNQLGLGVVGGRLYQPELEGVEAAHIAIRILRGEPATNFPPKIIAPAEAQYDFRELRRWNISEKRLPPGSVVRFRRPNFWGRNRTWIIIITSALAAQGTIIGLLLVNRRRRRRAEKSLRESEERMKLAATAGGLRLWEWDMIIGRFWVMGQRTGRIGSKDGDAIHLKDLLQTVHPDDRAKVDTALMKCLEGGSDFALIHRGLTSDGKTLWIASQGRVEFDKNGKPVRMRGVSLDITRRKEAEERAQESEGKFLAIANSTPVLMWSTGTDKLCTFVNQRWLDFTGRALEQELGNGWAEVVHSDEVQACMKVYVESFDARKPFTMQYRARRHDGEYRWILDHGVPRYDSDRTFLGYIGSCVDVTDYKRAQEEAERSRDELAHVTRVATLRELGGSLAHELSQPLTAILTNAQAAVCSLDAGNGNLAQIREILGDIVEEDRRAGEIISRMRAMLKKEHAKMLPQDLNEIIREVLGLMHSELQIRKVRPIIHLAPNLPKVNGDRVRLQQVLINLIVNACDAMATKPPPTRQITIETHDAGGGFVQASVADLGTGFDLQDSREVFEPFRTTKPHGLGLGLPICRSIIESHGGRLWVSNNGYGGAIVRFTVRVETEVKVPLVSPQRPVAAVQSAPLKADFAPPL